ncbi:hypothetical protein CCH79_00020531 [Gambusia affinis]|uniref:Uncharacterized protein n=1 Tax=Gambusia affinis TaxID=33528 RepID=A0A315UVP3_GAMAF|nr:hypothetical protein CCH79_00020531 [Gambusia affinis]
MAVKDMAFPSPPTPHFMTEGPDQGNYGEAHYHHGPRWVMSTIKYYVEAVASPYSACQHLGISTRMFLMLDYWILQPPHLGLVELQ